MLLGALNLSHIDSMPDPFSDLQGEMATVEGYVASVQKKGEHNAKVELYADKISVKNRESDETYEINVSKEKILVDLSGDPDELLTDDGEAWEQCTQASVSEASSYGFNELTGRIISVEGTVAVPQEASNPRLFNYRLYLRTKGIRDILESNTWQCIVSSEKASFVPHAIYTYKNRFLSSIESRMGDEAYGLMSGIMFGEKALIGDQIYQDFQRNGTAHILSVSGLHTAIVFLWVMKLFGSKTRIMPALLAVSVLIIYAALSEFSPSVVRAVFMIAVCLLGKFLHERYDLTACCSFTALFLLIRNPYSIFSLGFQLSYLAVFSLAILQPYLGSHFRRICTEAGVNGADGKTSGSIMFSRIERMIVPLAAIQLGMIPAIAYCFNYLSLSAFWVNIPVAFLATLILPVGLLMMVLLPIIHLQPFGIAFDMCGIASELFIDWMIWINRFAASLDSSCFNVTSPSLCHLAAIYALLFFTCSETGQWLAGQETGENGMTAGAWKDQHLSDPRIRTANRLAAVSLLLILGFSIIVPPDQYRAADIVFLDVGQGDCIHIRTPKGKNILIDSGGKTDNTGLIRDLKEMHGFDVGKDILHPYLLKNGAGRIDIALVTHLHQDHFQGLCSLSEIMEIKAVCIYKGNQPRQSEFMEDLHVDPKCINYIKYPDKVNIESDIFVEILYPDKIRDTVDYEDENEMNMVMRLNYKGKTILITGDLTPEDELKILEAGIDVQADILKVAHHGSRFSTTDAFLEAVDPEYAVIQVGKNNFGHPSADVIDKLEKKGIIIMRTDQDHATLFDLEQDKPVRILTMKSGQWQAFL